MENLFSFCFVPFTSPLFFRGRCNWLSFDILTFWFSGHHTNSYTFVYVISSVLLDQGFDLEADFPIDYYGIFWMLKAIAALHFHISFCLGNLIIRLFLFRIQAAIIAVFPLDKDFPFFAEGFLPPQCGSRFLLGYWCTHLLYPLFRVGLYRRFLSESYMNLIQSMALFYFPLVFDQGILRCLG